MNPFHFTVDSTSNKRKKLKWKLRLRVGWQLAPLAVQQTKRLCGVKVDSSEWPEYIRCDHVFFLTKAHIGSYSLYSSVAVPERIFLCHHGFSTPPNPPPLITCRACGRCTPAKLAMETRVVVTFPAVFGQPFGEGLRSGVHGSWEPRGHFYCFS